jgi:hypothetical protein
MKRPKLEDMTEVEEARFRQHARRYSGFNASPNGTQLPFGAGSLFAPTPSPRRSVWGSV